MTHRPFTITVQTTNFFRFWTTTIACLAACLSWSLSASPEAVARRPASFADTSEPFQAARWIAPPELCDTNGLPVFRKEFGVASRPRRATLRIVGLGDYDARVNGERLAEIGINQPWSQYEKTVYYRDYDITALLRRGPNCVGVMLANSFWHNPNPPKGRYNKDGPQRAAQEPFLLRAEIIMEDGSGAVARIGTDDSWAVAAGPLTFSHIFAGEDFEARRELPGWDRPAFADQPWSTARLAADPRAALVFQHWPPVEPHERFSPDSIQEPAPGVFLYSFPQNCSAQIKFTVAGGKPGQRVQFRGGEHRKDDKLFGAYIVDSSFVTDGKRRTHQWISFYLGMQFAEVTGAVPKGHPNPQGLPVLEQLELVHVRTALPSGGEFACSSELFNRTHRLVDWAMRANCSHVLTDCPHREKLGWLECAYLLTPSFHYRYQSYDWFDKILGDIRDAQEPSGRVLTVAPSYPAGKFPDAFNWTVEWGAAAVMLPWLQYEWSGDATVLRENFDMMRRFTDCVQRESKDGLAPGGLGDWYDYGHGQPPGPSRFTPTQLSATATWALCALTVSRAAEVLGHGDKAAHYRSLHAQIVRDFQRHFRDPSTRKLKHLGSPQCANAMAICARVVPDSDRELLIADIISDLEKRGYQQTPGDIGHVYFIRALAEAGRSDVLHRVYSREGQGSYGGILAKGLTSMPETWDAMMDGYQSLNHCMLGHVMEWFYAHVGGIRQQPGTVGWRAPLIAPNPGTLTHASTIIATPVGQIASNWKITKGNFRLEAELPSGISGLAVLPSGAQYKLGPGKTRLSEAYNPQP